MSHLYNIFKNIMFSVHLRNEFDFWMVHGIVNTLGFLPFGLHVNFTRDPKYS